MIIKTAELETVCGLTSRFPDSPLPQLAFAGKSNVGKSSLINALMNRKSLARTSAQPGKTQTINFYNVNGAFYLVDLPGYGYTKAAVEVREKWGQMVERYLHSSKTLRTVFLLVDIRHAPGENDRIMYRWIRTQGYAPVIIATKADKIKRSQLSRQLRQIREGLETEPGTLLFPFSAQNRQGREEIYAYLDSLLEEEEGGGAQ